MDVVGRVTAALLASGRVVLLGSGGLTTVNRVGGFVAADNRFRALWTSAFFRCIVTRVGWSVSTSDRTPESPGTLTVRVDGSAAGATVTNAATSNTMLN
jgi:hypothetical protein